MSASLANFALSEIAKMRYLHCVVKSQLRKLGCALAWYKNVPQWQNCVAPQLNQIVHCGSCAALQKLKN